MAGFLPKDLNDFHKIPQARIAIIASSWHPQCVNAMVERAKKELVALDVSPADIQTHVIPGALELPFAARQLLEREPQLDAIIAFGVVLKGDTTHDDSVLQTVVDGFSRASERYNTPIINEVIGVTSLADAEKRSDDSIANKGVEAVYAVSELLHWQKTLSS